MSLDTSLEVNLDTSLEVILTGLDTSLDARNLDVSLEHKGIGFLTQERVLTQGISDRPSNSTGDEPTNSGAACCSTTSESRIGLKSDRRQPPSSDWLSG